MGKREKTGKLIAVSFGPWKLVQARLAAVRISVCSKKALVKKMASLSHVLLSVSHVMFLTYHKIICLTFQASRY